MAILAYSSKQVRAVEAAMGGRIPKELMKAPRAAMKSYLRERFQQRSARLAETEAILAKARAPMVEMLGQDKRTIAARKELHKLFAGRPGKAPAKRVHSKIEARIVTGSNLVIKVPPYDSADQDAAGTAQGSGHSDSGTYTLNANSNGWAWAAVIENFLATADNPSQRFAALVDYDYNWFDWSALATAHNDGATHIWIWGFTENRWVYQSGQALDPSWSDGTGWYESHGSGGDGSWQSGTEAIEAYFPAFGNHWYQAWVWSGASCDSSAYSGASLGQNMTVPYMVLGSL
jgi:hypothetical protein